MLKFFGEFYEVKRIVAELEPEDRSRARQDRTRNVADALHQWLTAQRCPGARWFLIQRAGALEKRSSRVLPTFLSISGLWRAPASNATASISKGSAGAWE